MNGRILGILLVLLAGCTATEPYQARELNQEGVALMNRRDFAAAEACFQKAVQLEPDNPTSRYNLGAAAHQVGDWQRAETAYRECLRLDPNHPGCRHALGLLLLQQDRGPECWRMMETWVAEKPDLAEAQAEYGWLLRESGDLPAAQARLQQALELDPKNTRALLELGIIYETYSYPDRARALYERALLRDPNQVEAITRLARLRRSVGEP